MRIKLFTDTGANNCTYDSKANEDGKLIQIAADSLS